MSDEALKLRLTDFLCEVPFPRFVQSQGVVNIVADDLAGWLTLFISYETKPLTAVADAARALHEAYDPDDGFCCSKDVAAGMGALGVALDALDGEQRG